MTDFIQNHPIPAGRPILSLIWKLAGVAYPAGGVPVDIRLSFTDRKLARRSLEKLFSWDFDKLVIAHGVCIDRDAKPFISGASATILPNGWGFCQNSGPFGMTLRKFGLSIATAEGSADSM